MLEAKRVTNSVREKLLSLNNQSAEADVKVCDVRKYCARQKCKSLWCCVDNQTIFKFSSVSLTHAFVIDLTTSLVIIVCDISTPIKGFAVTIIKMSNCDNCATVPKL